MSVKTASKPNPFANCKPRSQWKRAKIKGRVRGRVFHDIQVGDKDGQPDYRLFVFELTSAGLTVRQKHGRKKNAVHWPLEMLAKNKASGQIVMPL